MSNVEDIRNIKLNGDQQNVVEMMIDHVTGPNLFFRLDGSAGTGKSTSAAFAGREMMSMGIQLALAAPTNKATRNLNTFKRKISPAANIPVGTIYSQLGLVLGKDGEVREVGMSDRGHKLEGVQALIVDESSMVNEMLMGYIHSFAVDTGTKVIFMGDPRYQLPPVGEAESAVERLHLNASLTKVERHDNQILRLATHLRDCIDAGTRPTFKSDRDEEGGVSVMRSSDFRKMIRRAFSSEIYDQYPDAFKALAWRNVIVDDYNESIRDEMYNGRPATPFEIGERIVAKEPVLDVIQFRDSGEESFLATTDEEGTVVSVVVQAHPVYGEVEVYAVTFTNTFDETVTAYLPTEAGRRVVDRRLKELGEEARADRKRWGAFWTYKGLFANLAPCHSLTVHRSQGSTYRTAFVDLDDLMVNRNFNEMLRMAYTACTRPSKSLILKYS